MSPFSIRPSIGTENPIPEEMDHCEIAVRVPMMNEVQLLFPSEPCKPLKPRSVYVVFLVEEDVRVERHGTCDYLSHEEIDWQQEVCTCSYQKHRNEEEGPKDQARKPAKSAQLPSPRNGCPVERSA